jgi:hypothetical protein
MASSDRWARLRYDLLLAAASRGRALGRAYAELAGAVEFWRGAERRRVATARVARWLGCGAADGARVFHRSLVSEALEEADCARFMRDRAGLRESFRVAGPEPAHAGATVYATLHFGSPILAYVYLRCVRGIDLAIIGRRLDDANPMPAAKRRFGERKVAWLETVTGRPLLGVDAAAVAHARGELLDGRSLYAAVDVPGDVAARVHEVVILGARVRLSLGVLGLAALTGAAVQPVVAIHEGGAIVLRYGASIAGRRGVPPLEAVAEAIGALIRESPGEWWLWPYVMPAGA